MTGFMGLTFSAFAGICFVSGLAVLICLLNTSDAADE